jgi:DNA-binding NtrC family response regulator
VNAPRYDADLFRETIVPDAVLPPLRILVVEDEGLIALNLELMLRRFGCEIVGPISEVGDIVGAARKHNPDGAFLDVNLRGRKVFDVLPEMMGLGVPCVLSSGYDDPMLFPAAFRDLPRIAKPFDEKALRRACAAFGSLAEARTAEARSAEARQAESKQAELGGEHRAVPFPRRRRRPLPPTLPLSPEGVVAPKGRAAAGPRGQ